MSRPAPAQDGAEAEAARVLWMLSLCGAASSFTIRFLDPLVGVVARDLSEDPHRIALIASAFALPYALIQPILAPIGDALGKLWIIRLCVLVMTVALFASMLAPNADILFGLRVLSGAAAGGVIPLSLATIGDRVPMAGRQIAMSRFLLFTITGQLAGGILSGLLAGWIGWRGVFALAGSMGLVATLVLQLGPRDRTARTAFSLSVALRRYRGIVAIPRARALFTFVFIEGIVIYGIQPYIAPLLEARGAGGPLQASLILAAFGIGGLAYSLSVRWLLSTLGLARMMMAAGALGGLGYAVLAFGLSWQVDALAMLVLGLGFYALHNSYQTQVSEVVSEGRGSAVSLHAFSYFSGQALGPVLVGIGLASIDATATILICGVTILGLGLASRMVLLPAPRS